MHCAVLQAALPVGLAGKGYLKAEEPADNIMRTRTYDLYITYDQVLWSHDAVSHATVSHAAVSHAAVSPYTQQTHNIHSLHTSTCMAHTHAMESYVLAPPALGIRSLDRREGGHFTEAHTILNLVTCI